MKKWAVLLLSIFLVSCTAKQELQVAEQELQTANQRIMELESQIILQKNEQEEKENSLNSTIADLEVEIKTNQSISEDEISQMSQKLEDLTADYDLLVVERDELQEKYQKNRDELASKSSQVVKLSNQVSNLVCREKITNMKYDNIPDASTILSAWWARQSYVDRVVGSYRDQIWSNTQTRVHGIRYIDSDDKNQYVEHFIVYFNEIGMEQGVFWVKGQCWLDEP